MPDRHPESPSPASGHWGRFLQSWGASLLEGLYPGRCALCLDPAPAGLCAGCVSDLARPGPSCPTCAEPLPFTGGCPSCQRSPPALDAVSTPFVYAWPLSHLLLAYKGGGRPQLARPLGSLLAGHLPETATGAVDRVIPVPLHEGRLVRRGFNQAEELARVLCRRRGLFVDTRSVTRVRSTPSQQGLSRRARRANLRGAFAVSADLSGERILLLDDVMTTGTTLNELADAVRRAGATRVTAVALARA
ncbi:ComF family protein [Thioalkalivibrio sp.]|uniref:ComF family protein n=1 Tax=Thioalkalivibrio sp. TaxID=2093813 RepID=UPI0035642EED